MLGSNVTNVSNKLLTDVPPRNFDLPFSSLVEWRFPVLVAQIGVRPVAEENLGHLEKGIMRFNKSPRIATRGRQSIGSLVSPLRFR